MTKEECQNFVKKVISHAMARDGSSGGVVRLVTIDQTGVEKEVVLGMFMYEFVLVMLLILPFHVI